MIHVPDVDIRQHRPGYPETYYQVFENLDEIVNDIAPRHDLSSATCFEVFEGELNAVIGLAKGGERFVLKIAPFDDLHNEAYFYQELRAQGLPVPELIGSDLSRQLVPYMYLITRYIKSMQIDDLRPSELQQFGFRVGHDLRWLHAVSAEKFGYRLPSDEWSHTDSYGPLRDQFLQSPYMEKRHELFSPAELRRIESLLRPDDLMIERPFMIHGDVRLRNFLYRKSHNPERELEISAIIDPGLIIAGDPMWDLATAMNDDPIFGEGVIAGYTQERRLTERDYERFHRLRLLAQYWLVCWQFATQRDYTQALTKCFDLLEELSRL